DKVVALRILPGVDVLEQRWAAAEKLFDEAGIDVVDHFTEGDPATIKKVVSDELAKSDVQGIWMDAGDGAVSAIEAFEDAGKDYPVMTGEDELSFLRKWDETGMTAIAPVYTNFQWRTPLLAAEMIFEGQEVPSEWVLPQDPITADELDEYLDRNEGMPMATTRSSAAKTCRASRRSARIGSSPDRVEGRIEGSDRTADRVKGAAVREIGVNTWVWVSPLTDARLGELADRARGFGFDLLELPVERLHGWDAGAAAEALAA